MVVLPAGSFTMGSSPREPARRTDEGPQHDVVIEKPFALGRLLVTVEQFAAFVADTHHDAGSKCWGYDGGKTEERQGRTWRTPGYTQDGSHPAVCLNLYDATTYVDWLVRKTGKDYRLPTEAESEYAAGGRTVPGTYPRFWFGDSDRDLCRHGNVADQRLKEQMPKVASIAPCNDGYAFTSPAGRFDASEFGVHDVFGNVWQWTSDCYHPDYNGAPTDGRAWTSADCSKRVLRGSSWLSDPSYHRVASRGWFTPDVRDNDSGIRVARSLTR
jgi:formylglycine-generating enzyme required for sulfatase activity